MRDTGIVKVSAYILLYFASQLIQYQSKCVGVDVTYWIVDLESVHEYTSTDILDNEL